MFKTRVYLYDSSQENNGYRGQEFSQHILQGYDCKEDITQEMDTAEITLVGLSFQKEFDPETKFIIDFIEVTPQQETSIETKHWVISRDIVNQPILSDDTYFDHHISLIEPSVVAQKRLVDNIAITYKLKDVSLNERPVIADNDVSFINQSSQYIPPRNFGVIPDGQWAEILSFGKYFQFEGQIEVIKADNSTLKKEYINADDFKIDGSYQARFKLPKLAVYGGVLDTSNFKKMGYVSIDYKIEEYSLNDEYNAVRSWSGSMISNDYLYSSPTSTTTDSNPVYSPLIPEQLQGEWICEKYDLVNNNICYKQYSKFGVATPTYITQVIDIKPDMIYVVKISLHDFADNIPNIEHPSGTFGYAKYTDSQPTYYATLYDNFWSGKQSTPQKMTEAQTTASSRFVTYDLETASTIVYSSSIPYSALSLLQKAIINSSLYEKRDGVYIGDVNNSNTTFYIDPEFEDDLQETEIIENFYNQKNLWEIMIEVGHYIHSIPELRFGSNDRFEITFNRLGRTDEKQDSSNKVSIFNSRSVEDYISATSSYITNMVQLGGYIEEWVVPKTTNEQLLVSNDTAEIIVTKPIIELIQIIAKNNSSGVTADLTPFIYEENVYKTLSLDYQLVPNRGIALYYRLGTNVITGGQFQLPQANANIYSDYAIKKAIYCAFNGYSALEPAPTTGYWTDLKVQDFSFFVRYRTKDSVRQNHARPDLRKYLLNSKFDRFPEHNQFNNQTDIVVDSIKFGNNMFGKLIKTGNNSYEIIEWTDNANNLKHKGELYRINGELYYVAKVTYQRFSTYILSSIKYSKDYNELSAVIGIPSEPRFYEISEQSLIWREFAINDLLLLTDNKSQLQYKSNYVFNLNHLSGLVLGENTDFAKYAVTVFKGDKDSVSYSQAVGQSNFYKEILTPINAYSSENTLTYEWDMADNYSAGDKVLTAIPNNDVNFNQRAYSSLRAVGYTDIYGKSALLDFYILGDIGTLSLEQIEALPESPIKTKRDSQDTRPFVGDLNLLGTNVLDYNENFNGRGLGLLKDCREAISINFNLQLITNSDTFVISPFVYLPQKDNIKIVLLTEEVNKLSSGYIDNSKIITPISKNGTTMQQYFDFEIIKESQTNSWDSSKSVVTNFGIDFASVLSNVADEHFVDTDGYQRVKSIAVICDVSLNPEPNTIAPTIPNKSQFIFARNIPSDWIRDKALSQVYFGAPNKDEIFNNKQ